MQGNNQAQLEKLVPILQNQIKQLQISTGWEQFADGNVQGYKKKSTGNSVITKIQTIVNISLQKLIDFFSKQDSFQKLNENCILHKLLTEKKGKYKILYAQMKTPFPLDNRDAVTMSISINQGNKYYIGVKSCNYPLQVPDKYVRAQMNMASWIFQKVDQYRTRVTNLTDMDPMGSIPDFVKNGMTQKRVDIVKNLQKTLKKQGY